MHDTRIGRIHAACSFCARAKKGLVTYHCCAVYRWRHESYNRHKSCTKIRPLLRRRRLSLGFLHIPTTRRANRLSRAPAVNINTLLTAPQVRRNACSVFCSLTPRCVTAAHNIISNIYMRADVGCQNARGSFQLPC
jgi:hypothetical protein